jgi:hypothetical protein
MDILGIHVFVEELEGVVVVGGERFWGVGGLGRGFCLGLERFLWLVKGGGGEGFCGNRLVF